MNRSARLGLAVVFVALLATPAIIRRFGDHAGAVGRRRRRSWRPRTASSSPRSSRAAGIEFVHEAPTLDPKLSHIMPQVASMGAAVAVADVDADGQPDLYVTNSKEGSKNRLYRNRGDGTFEDVAGAVRRRGSQSAARPASRWAPCSATTTTTASRICLLYRWGRPELFHNEGGRRFTRVTAGAGLPALGQHQHRDLVRLRSRRPARPVPRRLLSRAPQSLEARRHEDHAGELRVREQRRPQVPVSQPGRRAVRRGQREGRA